MIAKYLETALAVLAQRDQSDRSDQSLGANSEMAPEHGLWSQRSLTSLPETPRRCRDCRRPLAADRLEQCRACSAATLRRLNPHVADEIYGPAEDTGQPPEASGDRVTQWEQTAELTPAEERDSF